MARARVARSLLAGGIGAGIGASFSNAAGLLGLGAATSVLLAPAFALRSFAGFEQEAKNIEAIQGEQGFGKTSIARAIKQARDIGRETQFGAREIAEVQTFLSRRGFGIPELLEATPAIVDLAAAGGVPLHTAAQSTTSLLEQFGLGTDQTRSIVDQIALASITTPADVSSISEAMKHAGSLSSFAGMDPASAIAAVSASIGAGKAPGLAGRGLRAALRESMQQDAKDVFKKFGISGPFNDKGEFDFVKLVKEFERVFPNMDREQRASMLFESLETVGGSFMADLLRVGSAELEAREERLRTQSGGTAKRLRGIQDQTIGRASERLVDALQDLAFEGISPLADDIRELLDFTSGLIQAFSTSDGFRSFIGLVDEFVESFQRGTHMIGPLASEFTGWLGRMIEPLTNFYWVTSGLSDAMRGTNFIDLPNSIADVFDRLSFAVRNIGDVMIIAADSILALVDQLAQGMGFGNVVPQGVRDWFSDMAQSAQESINVREAQRRAEADGDNPKNRQKQGAADGGGLAGMGGGQFKPSFVGIGQLNSTIQSRLNDPAFKMQKQQVDLAKQQVKLQEKIAKGVAANKPAVAGAP